MACLPVCKETRNIDTYLSICERHVVITRTVYTVTAGAAGFTQRHGVERRSIDFVQKRHSIRLRCGRTVGRGAGSLDRDVRVLPEIRPHCLVRVTAGSGRRSPSKLCCKRLEPVVIATRGPCGDST